VTPLVLDGFTLGEHEFLVLEFIDGLPLNKMMVQRYPLTDPDATSEALADYAAWATSIQDQVTRAVHALHERGVVYGDLHMFNIIVRTDGRVALLDFEVAADESETRRPGLRNQGFAAPRSRSGREVDEYALACLRLALFLPLTALLRLDAGKARHLADIVADNFPVPAEPLDRAVATITGAPPAARRAWPTFDSGQTDPEGWRADADALARAITASATPHRDDRLFPGDIEQFRLGGLGIAYGAAGVLYALHGYGAPVDPEHRRWLARRALEPAFDTRHGFLDGLHGVAYVLDELGERATALDVVDRCLTDAWEGLNLDLAGGISGIGLNLRHFADVTGEPTLAVAALRAAELVADRLGPLDAVPRTSGGDHPHAGLVHGSSGPALLMLRTYAATGDTGYLDLARTALRQDLRRCTLRPDGAMEVDEGWRTMPYLAEGSLGIGLVLDEYLTVREDEEFASASTAIARAARSPLYVQSGLFAGRAGVVAYLATRERAAADRGDPPDPELAAQLRRLAWHGIPFLDGLAFPGEQLLRLSMDLATGTAGVLLAVAMARHDPPALLPLIGSARRSAKNTVHGATTTPQQLERR
jgi:hypothetical protein